MFSRGPTNEPPKTPPIQPARAEGQSSGQTSPGSGQGQSNAPNDPFAPASKMTASTIGTDLTILGEKITIISQYMLQIDGDVRADINGKKVTIGPEGSVIGTITADSVEIHGGLRGAVNAESVLLQSTAQVEGDIHHQTLSIAEGAEFDGSVRRPKDPASLKPNLNPATYQNGSVASANRRNSGNGSGA